MVKNPLGTDPLNTYAEVCLAGLQCMAGLLLMAASPLDAASGQATKTSGYTEGHVFLL